MSGLPEVFDRTVTEGERRLGRSASELLATGFVGGADISVGIFALYAVKRATHNDAAAALAFSIGFIALNLARSELFTENFLVPIATLAARKSTVPRLLRLWGGSLASNLLGGWVVMAIVMSALPDLRHTAVAVGSHYPRLGIGWTSFADALLGGAVITLMTWMEHSSESTGAHLMAAVVTGFLLAIGPLNHAIVVSLEMFSGLQAGAPYGYADWLGVLAWAGFGNIVGGVGLVTVLRLIQIGKETIDEEAQRPPAEERPDSGAGRRAPTPGVTA